MTYGLFLFADPQRRHIIVIILGFHSTVLFNIQREYFKISLEAIAF